VKEKTGISYSWRSIVRGIQALNKGLIWRVGDGTQINVLLDPWIPDGVTRRPITPRGHTVLTKVSELIDPATGDWDRHMVQAVFWEEDWKRILSIPIKHGMEDLLAWHFDSKGNFSVKSAYHVLDDCRERDASRQHGEGSSSASQSSANGFRWKQIWKLHCPPKVRHFFWRFTHNSLPVRRNINRRGMDIDTRCPVCWRLDEDGGHCFLKCEYVKECWWALNLEEERIRLTGLSSAMQVSAHVLSLS